MERVRREREKMIIWKTEASQLTFQKGHCQWDHTILWTIYIQRQIIATKETNLHDNTNDIVSIVSIYICTD